MEVSNTLSPRVGSGPEKGSGRPDSLTWETGMTAAWVQAIDLGFEDHPNPEHLCRVRERGEWVRKAMVNVCMDCAAAYCEAANREQRPLPSGTVSATAIFPALVTGMQSLRAQAL